MPPPSKPTVMRSDAVRLAGVRTAVVGYVLNGSKNVSSKTTGKVHGAVAMLGYRPDHAARVMRLGSGPVARQDFDVAGGYAAGRALRVTETLPSAPQISSDIMAIGPGSA